MSDPTPDRKGGRPAVRPTLIVALRVPVELHDRICGAAIKQGASVNATYVTALESVDIPSLIVFPYS